MTSPATRYRELVADLVAAARRHAAADATAQESYAHAFAALEHDLAAAEAAVAVASAEVTLAERTVAQTDLAAAQIWEDLKGLRGRRGRRLGPVPPPAPTAQEDPLVLLGSASARLQRAREGAEPRPRLIWPVLFGTGALAALVVAGVWLALG